MCTFDRALHQLYTENRISLDEALHNADSRTDLALRVRLAAGVSTLGYRRSVHRHVLAHPVGCTVGLTAGALMQLAVSAVFRDAAGDDTLAGAEAIVFTLQTKPATVHWSGLTFRHN